MILYYQEKTIENTPTNISLPPNGTVTPLSPTHYLVFERPGPLLSQDKSSLPIPTALTLMYALPLL